MVEQTVPLLPPTHPGSVVFEFECAQLYARPETVRVLPCIVRSHDSTCSTHTSNVGEEAVPPAQTLRLTTLRYYTNFTKSILDPSDVCNHK